MIIVILLILLIFLGIFNIFSGQKYRVPEKIFCTLTTIPERIEKLEKTLKSIGGQTLVPTYIILNIPKKTRKGGLYDMKKIYELAEKYVVFVNIIEMDLGPITKIIPTLEFVNSGDKIFIIDDDTVYDKNTLKKLYDSKLPAVGFYGRKNLEWHENTTNTPMQMDFLESYGGVLYDADILSGLKPVESCDSQDDIVIGKHLKNRGINAFIINSKEIKTKSEGDGTPQLRDQNVLGNGNRLCYNTLFSTVQPDEYSKQN